MSDFPTPLDAKEYRDSRTDRNTRYQDTSADFCESSDLRSQIHSEYHPRTAKVTYSERKCGGLTPFLKPKLLVFAQSKGDV